MIHSMKCKKGDCGWMAIKNNLEKAYDCIKWALVEETISYVDFLGNFIRMVMACISSTSISVLLNRKALESFKPSRGIRQRHMISPYIFMLCIQRLFHLINVVVKRKV